MWGNFTRAHVPGYEYEGHVRLTLSHERNRMLMLGSALVKQT